jgi:pyruvate kinase
MLPPHKTKIVCTIGPASDSPDVMEKLVRAGMDVARLNLSHGTFDGHRAAVRNLRVAARAAGKRVAVMADLPGPKVRIGKLAGEPVELEAGGTFVLTTADIEGDSGKASVTFQRLPDVVKTGDVLFLNDGIIQLEVLSVRSGDVSPEGGAAPGLGSGQVRGGEVACKVVVGGELRSGKGLNLPGIDLGIGAFTERDREGLHFAAAEGIDAVSQSFVESAADIEAVRRAAEKIGYHPFVIAKIERANALDHIDDILEAADGIMIARGDLGVEVAIERIAVIQKDLTRRAGRRAKPVITATQMLQSMTQSKRPTRAEVTDVANAILDGTDGVMLSEESAMGRYPVESAAMLARIAAAVEPHKQRVSVKEMNVEDSARAGLRPSQLVAIGVEASLDYASPAAIFVPTRSGATARRLSRFKPPVWIVAIASEETTCQGLVFSWGVYPVHEPEHPDEWCPYVRKWLADHGVEGEIAVLTEGPSRKHPEANHRMEIIELRGRERSGE